MTSTTRSCSRLWIGRRARHRLAVACLAVAVAVGWTAVAAPADAPKAPAPAPPAQVVMVKGERLTVDLRGAELTDVLQQVADAAGFHLTTTGELGHVTMAFNARTVEDGLRRLVQDHEMMLVYGPAGRNAGPAVLVEVQVFASGSARGTAAGPRLPTPRAGRWPSARSPGWCARATLSAGCRGSPSSWPRLPIRLVRRRAVWGLSMLGRPAATGALSGALRDEAPIVRGQAARAARRAASGEAIQALSSVLGSDPDVSVRREAARALAALGTPEADAALSAAAGDSDQLVRDRCAARNGSSEYGPALDHRRGPRRPPPSLPETGCTGEASARAVLTPIGSLSSRIYGKTRILLEGDGQGG